MFRNPHEGDQLADPPADRGETQYHTLDVGMTKRVVASVTFTATQATAANGTFSAFAAGDLVLVEGTALNNGTHLVTGIDAVNASFLTFDQGAKAEGPVTATIRTI